MDEQSRSKRFLARVGRVNLNEAYVMLLLTVGIPAIFYIYIDWRAAFVSFVVTQITIGILRERFRN